MSSELLPAQSLFSLLLKMRRREVRARVHLSNSDLKFMKPRPEPDDPGAPDVFVQFEARAVGFIGEAIGHHMEGILATACELAARHAAKTQEQAEEDVKLGRQDLESLRAALRELADS